MAKSKLLENLEYYPVKLLFYLFGLIPYKKGIEFGSRLFKAVFSILPSLRKVAFKNLNIMKDGIDNSLIFHEDKANFDIELYKKKFQKENFNKIYLRLARNLGRVFFNLIYYPKINEKEFVELINIIGIENVYKVLESNKGLVIASPHIGNWEVFGCAAAIKGIPVNVIVRPLDNKKLDVYIENFRTSKKVKIISKFESPKKFFKPLFDNKVMAVMFDQNALKHGVYVPFFKRPASATQGTARFHIVAKSPIMPGYSYYDSNGNLYGVFEKPFDFEKMFYALSYELKIFLFSFYEYFNKNNKKIPIYIFKNYLNFDKSTILFSKSESLSEIEFKSLYKENEKFIIEKYKKEFENYNELNKDEKVYFITYFIHKYYEPILLKHVESWMIIHPRWKKQPEEYNFPYK